MEAKLYDLGIWMLQNVKLNAQNEFEWSKCAIYEVTKP